MVVSLPTTIFAEVFVQWGMNRMTLFLDSAGFAGTVSSAMEDELFVEAELLTAVADDELLTNGFVTEEELCSAGSVLVVEDDEFPVCPGFLFPPGAAKTDKANARPNARHFCILLCHIPIAPFKIPNPGAIP